MKKIFLFLTSVSLLAFTGCGNGKTDNNANADAPQGMVAADLSEFGIQAFINVPDSTNGHLEMTANSLGGADIKVGKNFQISIVEGEGNIDLKKQDITSDEVRKLVKYVVEEPSAILWEWQMNEGGEPEFYFYSIIKTGNKSFEVFNAPGEVFSEKAATQMLDAAKSLRLKDEAKAGV